MTVVNPKSISGINSITTGSGSDNLLTIHTSDANNTERVRVNSSGDVIVGSGVTLSPDGDIFATGITTVSGNVKVGTGITLSPDGDVFATGVTTSTTFVGNLTGNVTGNISGGTVAGSTGTFTSHVSLGDSDELRLGDSSDLKIYHDPSYGHSFIKESGSGGLIFGASLYEFYNAGISEKMIAATADGSVELYHDNTKQCETSANGLSFPSGKGLDFSSAADTASGETVASSVLDDYEEGTWTPTFSSSGATFTYNHQSGTYTKVGDTVHVWFYITLHPSIAPSGTGTNSITIPLPFTASGVTRYEAGVAFGMIYKVNLTDTATLLGKVYQSTNYIALTYVDDDAAGGSYTSNRFDQVGAGLSGTVTYKVA